MRKLLLLLPLAFLVELILGGPGRWGAISGLTVRYWLFAGTLLSLVVLSFLHRPWMMRRDEVAVFAAVTLGAVGWVVLLPMLRWTPVGWATADGDALLVLYLYLPLAHLVRREAIEWSAVKRWTIGVSAVVAIVHLVLFVLGQFGGRPMGAGITLIMNDVMNSSGIYVGYVRGVYRVMWISSLFLLLGFLLVLRDAPASKMRATLLLLFGAALIVTYTRGFWVGAAIAVAFYGVAGFASSLEKIEGVARFPTLRLGPLLKAGAVLVLLFLGAAVTDFRSVDRLTASFDPQGDRSVALRSAQFGRLVEAWQEAPVTGRGFGSYVPGFPGAADAPYSYELTGPTLLMKTGLLGLSFALAVVLLFGWRARAAARAAGRVRWFHGWLALLLGLGLAFQTNPYLVNFVGMSIVVFLLVDVVDMERRAT